MAVSNGKNKNKLTPKQRMFVKEYLVDLNGTQAAIRAGYSKRTAKEQSAQLLTKLNIQVAIKSAMDDRSSRTEITQDYVLNTVYETIERCRQVEPVRDRSGEQVLVMSEKGELVPAFVFDAKNVLKGCELLGKHLGLFNEKVNVEHSGDIDINVTLKGLDDD